MTFADLMREREGYFEADPQIEHHFSDGLYAKRWLFPKATKSANTRISTAT